MPRPDGVEFGRFLQMYGDEVKDENGETIGVKMPFSDLEKLPSFKEHMDILLKAQMEELERRAELDGEDQKNGRSQRVRVEEASRGHRRLSDENNSTGGEPSERLPNKVRFEGYEDVKAKTRAVFTKDKLKSMLSIVLGMSTSDDSYWAFSHILDEDTRGMPSGWQQFTNSFLKGDNVFVTAQQDFEGGDKRVKDAKDVNIGESSFLHFRKSNGENDDHFAGEGKDIEGRLYMCPEPENVVRIMTEYSRRTAKEGLPLYFKIDLGGNRNDKIVIYSNKDNLSKHLNTLLSIQEDHLEWFQKMGENPMWGQIEGINGVYYGAEPKERGSSYGRDRSGIFARALKKWREETGYNELLYSDQQKVKNDLKDESIKLFMRLFKQECSARGIRNGTDFATMR